MARPRSAGYFRQREKILRAAAQIYFERGFAAGTVSEIARRCHFSKTLVYHYFSTKDEILFEVVRGHTVALVQLVTTVRNAELEARQKLTNLVESYLSYCTRGPVHAVYQRDARWLAKLEHGQIIRQRQNLANGVESILAAVRSSRSAPDQSSGMSAALLLGLLDGVALWHLEENQPLEPAAQAVAGMVLAMASPPIFAPGDFLSPR